MGLVHREHDLERRHVDNHEPGTFANGRPGSTDAAAHRRVVRVEVLHTGDRRLDVLGLEVRRKRCRGR